MADELEQFPDKEEEQLDPDKKKLIIGLGMGVGVLIMVIVLVVVGFTMISNKMPSTGGGVDNSGSLEDYGVISVPNEDVTIDETQSDNSTIDTTEPFEQTEIDGELVPTLTDLPQVEYKNDELPNKLNEVQLTYRYKKEEIEEFFSKKMIAQIERHEGLASDGIMQFWATVRINDKTIDCPVPLSTYKVLPDRGNVIVDIEYIMDGDQEVITYISPRADTESILGNN